MKVHNFHFAKMEAKLLERQQMIQESKPEALECRKDFIKFRQYVCNHDSPEHHLGWEGILDTGNNSKCLTGIGGKHTLILAPRGSAKSTFLVEWAAWVIGNHTSPDILLPIKILYVSYSIEVAMLKSEQIQEIIMSPKYQDVFPWVKPSKKWGQKIWDIDKTVAGLPTIGEPYTLSCAGLKGAVASKRAHLCLTADTLVLTEVGQIPISELHLYPGIKVATYNESFNQINWGRVKRIESRLADDIVEVKTSQGSSLRCTSNHPVYIPEFGYREAGDLVPGNQIIRSTFWQGGDQRLPVVWEGTEKEKQWFNLSGVLQRLQEIGSHIGLLNLWTGIFTHLGSIQSKTGRGKDQVLLQSQVSRERQHPPKKMSGLQHDYWRNLQVEAWKILRHLLKGSAQAYHHDRKSLPVVRDDLYASPCQERVLLPRLCEQGSFETDDWRWKQSLQGRRQLQQRVQGLKTYDPRTGWRQVCDLQSGGLSDSIQREFNEKWVDYPSQGRKPQKQQSIKPNYGLSDLSFQSSCNSQGWEYDTISSVTKLETGIERVYDIEVEGDHNFFANSILVHNCIFDDLIKSPEQIDNPSIREKMANNWSNVIRPVMYEGARAICLGTRMRADDIYESTFNPERGWEVITQGAITEDELTGEEKSYWEVGTSLKYLQHLREDDPTAFALQYMNVIPSEGEGVIAKEWVKDGIPPDLSEFDSLCIGSDLSSSLKDKADYTVFLLLGKKGDEYWVLDIRRGRWGGNIDKFSVLAAMLLEWGILDTKTEYEVDYRTGKITWLLEEGEKAPKFYSTGYYLNVFMEAVSYQLSFKSDWETHVQGEWGIYSLTCLGVKIQGDKLQRLRGITGCLQKGQVYWNKYRKHLKRAKQELLGFGTMGKDDCVDALVLGLVGMGARPRIDVA